MRDLLKKVDYEIKKIDRIAIYGIPFFVILIIFMPYILTREYGIIDLSKNGNIGSNIGGITAPFIGTLSALLVYLSFRAQIRANRIQIEAIVLEREKNRLNEDLKFVHYRLSEIQSFNSESFKSNLLSINMIISNIENLLRYGKDDIDKDKRLYEIITEKKNDLLVVFRYLNLFSIIETKLDEIKNEIDIIQSNYIFSVIKHEYYTIAELYVNNYLNKVNYFKKSNAFKELLELESLLVLCDRVSRFIKK